MAIQLILADDHPVVTEGVKLMLQDNPEINCEFEARNGLQVLDYLLSNKADLILMDLEMPEMNGIKCTEKVVELYPLTKVIAFTNYADYGHLQQMLKAGAKAYLLKNCSKQELLECIHKVLSGNTYFSEDLTEMMIAIIQGKTIKKQDSGVFLTTLSRREKEILQMILNEDTTPEIAQKLFISIGTVETHRRNMMNKLKVKNTAGLVKVAVTYNLV